MSDPYIASNGNKQKLKAKMQNMNTFHEKSTLVMS